MTLSLNITPYAVPLAVPIRTSNTLVSTRRGWRVRLSCLESGLSGWGEVACWVGFGSGQETTERSIALLSGGHEEVMRSLADLELTHADVPLELQALREACTPIHSLEARHGIELAALDLRARALGEPLSALLVSHTTARVTLPNKVLTHCLIRDLESAQQAVERGYLSLKLKVGSSDHWSDDGLTVARISAYLSQGRSQVALRLDANQAWGEVDALGALITAQAYGVDWIEEPFHSSLNESHGWEMWSRFQRQSGATLAVDESLQRARRGEVLGFTDIQDRLRQALTAGVKVVTLKPMFTGGLLSCAELAREAHSSGARVCITHALEGAIGRRGAAHLSAALTAEGLEVAGGLTGALPVDVFDALEVRDGYLTLPDEPGLGVVSGGERCG